MIFNIGLGREIGIRVTNSKEGIASKASQRIQTLSSVHRSW